MNYNKGSLLIPFPEDVNIINCQVLEGEMLEFKKTGDLLQIELPVKQNELVTVIEISTNEKTDKIKTIEII